MSNIKFNSLPIDGPLRVTSKFGPRNTGIKGASTYHRGIDLGRDFSKTETNLLSVAPGKVRFNGWNKYRGWFVVIQHDGFETLYQHMKAQCSLAVGTAVKAGTVLGIMSNSSDTSVLKVSVHLHFALCKDFSKATEAGREYMDPLPYLQNLQPEHTYLAQATELASQVATAIIVGDKASLITALEEDYNGSLWWVIKKLLALDTEKTPIEGQEDIYRRTLAAIQISDTETYNNALIAANKNSLFWVIKKLLDKAGIE